MLGNPRSGLLLPIPNFRVRALSPPYLLLGLIRLLCRDCSGFRFLHRVLHVEFRGSKF